MTCHIADDDHDGTVALYSFWYLGMRARGWYCRKHVPASAYDVRRTSR